MYEDSDVDSNHDDGIEQCEDLGHHDLHVRLEEEAGQHKDTNEHNVEDEAVDVGQAKGQGESTHKHEDNAAGSDDRGNHEKSLVGNVEVGNVVVLFNHLEVRRMI